MSKKLLGMKELISNHTFLLCFIIIVTCMGCQFDPYADLYLHDIPPLEEIHGKWHIDLKQTAWPEAESFLKNEKSDSNQCSLLIKDDETFIVQQMPDCRDFGHITATTPRLSGIGEWVSIDRNTGGSSETASLALFFQKTEEELHGKLIKMLFRRNNDGYLLHITIGDPDSAKALVFRKSK